ncbi:MAG: hypothetical protein GF308_15915 [Candidatus Heimdallarchaeota archaeon]|nr:hypothetical protein [Candidatus Heimdallarchaeota archaeon]
MATFEDFIYDLPPGLSEFWNLFLWLSAAWFLVLIIVAVIIGVISRRRSSGVDITALAALTSSETASDTTPASANPKEVMAILSIERVAASNALSEVKSARRSKRISQKVANALINRYKARIAKIDSDLKRRSSEQEYQSLAASLEQTRDRLRDEVMPAPPGEKKTPPPPPPSSTPGIPSKAPPVPGSKSPSAPPSAPPSGPPSPPPSGPPSGSKHPSVSSAPPKPPKISPSSAPPGEPAKVVPPSVAPPSVSSPPSPPSQPSTTPPSAPSTKESAPPPVPSSTPSTGSPPATGEGDSQSISGLRMEMLRELARLKKFMSEESQD